MTSPIAFPGDSDAGGRDPVAGSVAESVAAAVGRYTELSADTYQQGSTIGDIVALPASPLDPGVGSTGTTDPEGHYYTPPRGY
jgi:hypothetical protein